MYKCNTAILVVGFNRPEYLFKVFESLLRIEATKLYLSIDGARNDKNNDIKAINEIKKYVEESSLNFSNINFHENNLGAELHVSSAISNVLKQEEAVIVLEDDIIASPSFFTFVDYCIEKYKNNHEVMMISGCQWTPKGLKTNESYFFGYYGHTWGWATWKRAWESFDLDFEPDSKMEEALQRNFSGKQREYWLDKLSQMKLRGKGNNTWDYCWLMLRLVNKGLSIIPSSNLTSNIGEYGYHAKGRTEDHHRPVDENFRVLLVPNGVSRNGFYDDYHFNNYLNKHSKLGYRIINRIKRYFL